MDTATQEPTKPVEQSQIDPMNPPPIDPENDMDGKQTAIWLVVAAVFVVISLWSLKQFYAMSLGREHRAKIDETPRLELRAHRSNEDFWLKKAMPLGEADERSLAEIELSIRDTSAAIIRKYVRD